MKYIQETIIDDIQRILPHENNQDNAKVVYVKKLYTNNMNNNHEEKETKIKTKEQIFEHYFQMRLRLKKSNRQ